MRASDISVAQLPHYSNGMSHTMAGWMIADPLCSMMIAVLIVVSVYPLMKDTIGVLLQRSPAHLDNVLPSCYRKVCHIEAFLSVVHM